MWIYSGKTLSDTEWIRWDAWTAKHAYIRSTNIASKCLALESVCDSCSHSPYVLGYHLVVSITTGYNNVRFKFEIYSTLWMRIRFLIGDFTGQNEMHNRKSQAFAMLVDLSFSSVGKWYCCDFPTFCPLTRSLTHLFVHYVMRTIYVQSVFGLEKVKQNRLPLILMDSMKNSVWMTLPATCTLHQYTISLNNSHTHTHMQTRTDTALGSIGKYL